MILAKEQGISDEILSNKGPMYVKKENSDDFMNDDDQIKRAQKAKLDTGFSKK